LIRAKNLTSSATAALELREALAKFCKSQVALQLLNGDEWAKFLKTIAQVHEAFECAASINKIDAGNREQLLQEVANLHSEMSMLSTIASEKAGETNAYSQ
jgi:predicted RNA-binding Zn ribbon-like protein